jgi:uncharacterized membrane protein
MARRAAVTVHRSPEEVERRWGELRPQNVEGLNAEVSFVPAPGDRGTEVHVELRSGPPAGRLGEAFQKLAGTEPLSKVKDDLRRFKQVVETGEVPRSEGSPEGELAARKLKNRPAQPLDESELEKAGA